MAEIEDNSCMTEIEDSNVVSTASIEDVKPGFVDEEFSLIDKSTVVPDIPNEVEPTPTASGGLCEPMDAGLSVEGEADFTEDDTMLISETLINLPTMIWDRLPERDPEKVKKFNKAFCRYCIKKGIDPYDYLFDEFEIGMIAISIAAGYRRDYISIYKNSEKVPDKVEQKQNAEYNHYADIASQSAEDKPEGSE